MKDLANMSKDVDFQDVVYTVKMNSHSGRFYFFFLIKFCFFFRQKYECRTNQNGKKIGVW